MIDDPGSFSGRLSSPRPARGPLPSILMSFEIFNSESAIVLSMPDNAACASCAARDSNLFGADTNGKPVRTDISCAMSSAYLGCELRPVPTAVPPMASSVKCTIAALARSSELRSCCAYPPNSWPRVMGTASIRCVRPIFTMLSHSRDFLSSSSRSNRRAGTKPSCTSYAVATDMAVGKVSLELCDMLTWSLGCTGSLDPTTPPSISMARLDMTSLTFMFVCVPLPVCQTTRGKLSSSFPSMTSRAATRIASARLESSLPRRSLTVAAACLTMARARSISTGIFSPPILKFWSERCVCAPQYLSAGTRTTPMVSLSSRKPAAPAPSPALP